MGQHSAVVAATLPAGPLGMGFNLTNTLNFDHQLFCEYVSIAYS